MVTSILGILPTRVPKGLFMFTLLEIHLKMNTLPDRALSTVVSPAFIARNARDPDPLIGAYQYLTKYPLVS